MAALLLLMAAFSFYLLQDPTAGLPFAPPPATSTSTPPIPSITQSALPPTQTPTRQTSYTPLAAFRTPNPFTPAEITASAAALTPPTLAPPNTPIITLQPSDTQTQPIPTTPAATTTPTATRTAVAGSPTATLSQGEYGVTGRVVQNGTPVPGVIVEFADDTAPRQSDTNSEGDYWFITLAPGTDYTLTFYQADNPNLTPPSEVASLAWLKGTLSNGGNIIELPDLEVSINLSGNIFELTSPDDGASVSATAISASIPLRFEWSSYNQNGSYHIELGPDGSNIPIWSSSQQAQTYYMWDGTLDDDSHITQGTYWWRVAVTKSLGNAILVVFTQPFVLIFTP